MNPFHNIAATDLADEYGVLKGQADAIDERLKAIKAELVARGADHVEGGKFTVDIKTQVAKRLDTKTLKEALGEDICAEYERESESVVIRVKPTVVFGQQAAA